MKFTIDRNKWRCGGDSENKRGRGSTNLFNSEGYQCCLGMVCSQRGIPTDDIIDILMPSETGRKEADFLSTERDIAPEIYNALPDDIKESALFSRYNKSVSLEDLASTINDDPNITDENREELLTKVFEGFGHELEFVGEYSV